MYNTLLPRTIALMFAVAVVASVFVSGCQQEPPASPGATNQAEILTVPPDVQEQLALFERITAESDRGEAHWVGQGDGQVVELPAGSVNGLAAALAVAGNNGVVLVRSGMHTESGMVTVNHKVSIIGQTGAIMVFDTDPDPNSFEIRPALRVLNTNHVTIWGLEIRPADPAGNGGILLHNARHCVIGNNILRDLQFPIFIERGDHATVWGNTVICSPATVLPLGITNCNGKHVTIARNEVRNGFFGIWACDEFGLALNNTMRDNFIGLILCCVPEGGQILPGGVPVGSDLPGTRWLTSFNQAVNNSWGYLVIDAANRNLIANNGASGNSVYDIELTADTFRFGFLTPASHNNTFIAGSYPSIIVKNCGDNNTIIGGQLVNTTTDPCN